MSYYQESSQYQSQNHQIKKSDKKFKIYTYDSTYINNDSKKFILEPNFKKDLQQKIKNKIKHKKNIKQHKKQNADQDIYRSPMRSLEKIEEKQLNKKSSALNIYNKKLLFEKISRKYESRNLKNSNESSHQRKQFQQQKHQRKGSTNVIKSSNNRAEQHLANISQLYEKKNYLSKAIVQLHQVKERPSLRPYKLSKMIVINVDGIEQSLEKKSPMIIKTQAINQRFYTHNYRDIPKIKEQGCILKQKSNRNRKEGSGIINTQHKQAYDRYRNIFTSGFPEDNYSFANEMSENTYGRDEISGWNYQ